MRFFRGLLVLAVLAGCSGPRASKPVPAPDFALKDLTGKTVRLKDFRGKPVLLDFWATWCGPCRVSMPLVQEFYNRHQEEGLVVLGLNLDEDPSGLPEFLKRFKITYPVLLAAGSDVSAQYQMEGVPLFIFIDADGRIVQRFDGFSFQIVLAWEEIFEQMMMRPA